MTRPRPAIGTRVRKVVNVLAEAIGGRDKVCIGIVEQNIRFFDAFAAQGLSGETWPPYPQSVADKNAAGRFGKAFSKLEDWFARLENGSDAALRLAVLQRVVFGEEIEFFEWKRQLAHWRRRFEAFAYQDSEPNLFFPNGDKSKSAQKFVLQRKAAAASAAILRAHGLPLAATPKRAPSRASILIRVAEFISEGLEGIEVEYECRKLARSARKANKVDYGRRSRNGPP